uniref:Uncharacterized protein n=1 Tax=Oryza nivara TaxID=4536 RepID=A0A0E0G4I2_ORYNI
MDPGEKGSAARRWARVLQEVARLPEGASRRALTVVVGKWKNAVQRPRRSGGRCGCGLGLVVAHGVGRRLASPPPLPLPPHPAAARLLRRRHLASSASSTSSRRRLPPPLPCPRRSPPRARCLRRRRPPVPAPSSPCA